MEESEFPMVNIQANFWGLLKLVLNGEEENCPLTSILVSSFRCVYEQCREIGLQTPYQNSSDAFQEVPQFCHGVQFQKDSITKEYREP